MNKLSIRRAKEEDVLQILQLRRKASKKSISHYSKSHTNAMINYGSEEEIRKAIKKRIVFVAALGKNILGSGSIDLKEKFIYSLFVLPKNQHKGIGTKIIKRLEKEARKNKIKLVQLSGRLNAFKFYQKNGFYKKRREYWRIGKYKIPMIRLEKKLIG